MERAGEVISMYISRRVMVKYDNYWNQKDLFPWCQNQFESKFKNIPVPSAIADFKIERAESVTGSMIVCNRKGKTIFVFDVQLKLDWSGKASSSDGSEVSGKGVIIVENIANDEDKWKIVVRIESETSQNRFLKEEMNAKVGPIIDGIVNSVLEEMKAKIQEEGAKATSPAKIEPVPVKPPEQKPKVVQSASDSSVSTRSFVQKVLFEAPLGHLYQTLTDPAGVSAFTGAPARIDNHPGGEFAILDGAIRGTQVELTPQKKIVQKWRFQTWPDNHFSNVIWNFAEERGGTLITLTQTDVPAGDYERTKNGWERFFWKGLRNTFGWSFKYQ